MTAPLFPEQQRALDYARKRGTDASLASIRSRVAGTYADVEAMVESIPPALTQRHHGAPGWCVQEVVDHLVESDAPAVDQLARLLDGEDVPEPIPASLQSAAPHDLAWSALLERFRAVHADILTVLSRATDATPLGPTAAVCMVVKCTMPDGTVQPVSWLHHLDWKAFAILLHAHNREHMAQIQRILSAADFELR